MLKNATTRIWDLLWRLWYPLVTRLARDDSVTFLNYGYDEQQNITSVLSLEAQDESDRPCIQLYHRVAGVIDLRGLDVLEISCGHGGGASYIARYLNPKSMRGVDRNAEAIEFCQKRHRVNNLKFSCGNALALGFDAAAFDAVVNVEASHCYPDVPQFFSEVRRVLRGGGHFLYADFRQNGNALAILRNQLDQSGLEMIQWADISANVVQGMQLNTEKYKRLIESLVPPPLRTLAMAFAGVKGSAIYNSLQAGETEYVCCVLRKQL